MKRIAIYPKIPVGGRFKFFLKKLAINNSRQLGIINNQRWIQTGIFAKKPISRGEKDSNSTCSKTLFIKRGKRFIRKKCNRTCCKSREPNRFLQYIFPSTKKEWKNETNHKFETPQPVSQETTFQNGHFEQSVESSETKRLGNINRFNRCISTHTNIFKTPEVSQILCRKPLLSMESHVLRTNFSTTCFTKMVSVIAAYLRTHSVRLAVHLDDWLFVNRSKERLLQDREKCLNSLVSLVFIINKEKFCIDPKQKIEYLFNEDS